MPPPGTAYVFLQVWHVALVLSSAVRVKCCHTADIVADKDLGKEMQLLWKENIQKKNNVNTAGQDSTYKSEAPRHNTQSLKCMTFQKRLHM